ncbi:hypothetical protein A2V49_01725 [candidate division WWE3 bacterium RBG_19FT_COMBO_34_6]|uniref:Ribose-5-phosphate isomerase n=1 Tax=candidate division WWE3 bacterium RBG_19FT_COMBO_34_6 TaxID=1802612 RepID=A0A1F4UJZ8_UNCKA|nr:MAG: hypothetical protein A2V49_01725 [candidate division WWE3 bacterium RBG_19FT_COMBO_34_6]
MNIIIAADHRGFELKNKIITYLNNKNIFCIDCGPSSYDPSDDYEDFVIYAMEKMQELPGSMGILICKNGAGVSISANKFKNIRCAISFNKDHIASMKNDDNLNVLAIPTEFIEEKNVFEIIDSFLSTPFSNEKRHIRRLDKLTTLENKNFKG